MRAFLMLSAIEREDDNINRQFQKNALLFIRLEISGKINLCG
ncbi:hypothetical protein CHAB381_0128 [Campylobacter hominis ATCC BAA-381]|uniref:Uncharacterized protein n=1 Tax=Campylobacter hominis (strain ATCC BAA-381 / DSM 21671 / CCUG 45161 / LMG 19568 / NCTC 13146 / CH001A) TaxID=360107 RepID=A7HZQ0_CAMHC|nr:hypothetical protein CHAB381_0128 [Campylobacter hominis ATCC BAA-381]